MEPEIVLIEHVNDAVVAQMPVEGNAVLEDASAMAGITTSPQSRESPMQRTSTMRHRN
jgi:hypothetical protein